MHQGCAALLLEYVSVAVFVIGLLPLLLPDAAAGQLAVRPNQDSLMWQ